MQYFKQTKEWRAYKTALRQYRESPTVKTLAKLDSIVLRAMLFQRPGYYQALEKSDAGSMHE